MDLTPEQRQQIYEEEQARMEARRDIRTDWMDGWVVVGLFVLLLAIGVLFSHGCPLGLEVTIAPK